MHNDFLTQQISIKKQVMQGVLNAKSLLQHLGTISSENGPFTINFTGEKNIYYSKTMDLSQFITLREKDLYLSLKKLIAAME